MITILQGVVAPFSSEAIRAYGSNRTFQATVSGTGAVSATVVVEATNDPSMANFLALGTITLSGTGSASDGFPSNTNWVFVRMRVSAVSGSAATVNGWIEVS